MKLVLYSKLAIKTIFILSYPAVIQILHTTHCDKIMKHCYATGGFALITLWRRLEQNIY